MNAVLVPKTEQAQDSGTTETAKISTAPAPPATTSEPAEQRGQLGFGAAQARVLPLSLLTVFALATASVYFYRGDLAGSAALGLYLAMWLGGGFGFLGGGILWAIGEMESDGAH